MLKIDLFFFQNSHSALTSGLAIRFAAALFFLAAAAAAAASEAAVGAAAGKEEDAVVFVVGVVVDVGAAAVAPPVFFKGRIFFVLFKICENKQNAEKYIHKSLM